MARRVEAEVGQRFRERYRAGGTPAQLAFERAVFGSDVGASGWTTVAQADDLARRLGLGPGDRLLDLGSGRGWPGLHLARTTGCDVVLTDQPVAALNQALARARADGTDGRCRAVAATARSLPFRPASFDAVVHTDVLC